MIPFSYLSDGLICDIGPPFEQFQEPSSPIPPTIMRLTGITDAMVAGQRIDVDAVRELVDHASLVIAHNASFDRRFSNASALPSFSSLWPVRCRRSIGSTKGMKA